MLPKPLKLLPPPLLPKLLLPMRKVLDAALGMPPKPIDDCICARTSAATAEGRKRWRPARRARRAGGRAPQGNKSGQNGLLFVSRQQARCRAGRSACLLLLLRLLLLKLQQLLRVLDLLDLLV
jgi:hypothetical protein